MNDKISGYSFRIFAILLWGIAPIVIRYTSAQELHPLLRVCLWTFFASFLGFLVIFFQRIFFETKWHYGVPYNRYFWLYVLSQIILSYSFNAALIYTSATTLNLFLNFTTIIGLMFLYITRKEVYSYFQGNRVFPMLGIFLVGIIGSIFLGYNELYHPLRLSVLGVVYCIIAIVGDVLLMDSNMRYTEVCQEQNGIVFTTNALFWVFIISSISFTVTQYIWKIQTTKPSYEQVGVMGLVGLIPFGGYFLTYEAFRRIDGILVYLMINLTAMITFFIEVLFFKEPLTTPLVIGSVLVISASVMAELYKSYCENHKL